MAFPFLQGMPAEIGDKFFLGNKLWDKGAKPYIAYKSGAAWSTTVGSPQWESFKYDNQSGNRHPVSILGLDVKAGGANGTLRKAEITIQFPSVDHINMSPWIDFFRIGNAGVVIWGWSYAGSGIGDFGAAPQVYNNVDNWRNYVSSKGYEHEMLVGLMTDFELTYNNNGTVNVVFTLSSPNELPGTLKLSKPDGQNTGAFTSDASDDRMSKVLNALKYGGTDDEAETTAAKAYFVKNTINVTTSWMPDFVYGNSDEPYSKLDGIINSVINNMKILSDGKVDFSIDISNVVARGHKHMISISENVIFPNANAPGFTNKNDDRGNRKITPTIASIQDLTIKKPGKDINFPSPNVIVQSGGGGVTNIYQPYEAGLLADVFMQVTWVAETLKTCDNVQQWLEKLCDELNYASCGLFDLQLTETTKQDGTLIYTIVDMNLTPKNSAAQQPYKLNPRGQGTSILELKLNTDLPKAMAAQAVLGSDKSQKNTGDVAGANLFAKKTPDAIQNSEYQEQKKREAAKAEEQKKLSKIEKQLFEKNGKKPTAAEVAAEETRQKEEEDKKNKEALEDSTGASFIESITNGVVSMIANMFNSPSPEQVKIRTMGEWKIDGYEGIGDTPAVDKEKKVDGNGGKSVFPIFKNRDAIANIIAGRKADAPAAFDGTSVLSSAEIELKCIGFAGLKNGYTMHVEGVPFGLNDKGYFQLTEIGHTVDATKWETSVKAKWRISRKK